MTTKTSNGLLLLNLILTSAILVFLSAGGKDSEPDKIEIRDNEGRIRVTVGEMGAGSWGIAILDTSGAVVGRLDHNDSSGEARLIVSHTGKRKVSVAAGPDSSYVDVTELNKKLISIGTNDNRGAYLLWSQILGDEGSGTSLEMHSDGEVFVTQGAHRRALMEE